MTLDDFTVAVERIVAGLEKKNRLLNPQERRVVACHEMGHALVALSLPGTDVIHKVSIIPRGIGAFGYTIQQPTEDRFLMTRQELENKMQVLLGGRAAEHIVFGEVSTGASDLLQKVTSIARAIVMRYGMHEKLGNVVYEEERQSFLGETGLSLKERNFSEETAREIDSAVRSIVGTAFQCAVALLIGQRDVLEKETLNEPDLQRLREALKVHATQASLPADGPAPSAIAGFRSKV